ncbi:hypothetical protein HPB50_011664 [Hyalomma asiaticum]|uniref:Uncharacterized protein n=1 Tax=Hyalomma asiaticum TaxID=266040 RepID=A0ACB7S6D1_HYAAI|nr:hypothetical protein HPB50_011664 [Hyalomma asiaticum]
MRTTSEPPTEARNVQAARRHNLIQRHRNTKLLRWRVGPGRQPQIHARLTLRRLSFRQLNRPRPEQLPPARRRSPVPKTPYRQPHFQLCVGVHV